jgi:hypothetical protein
MRELSAWFAVFSSASPGNADCIGWILVFHGRIASLSTGMPAVVGEEWLLVRPILEQSGFILRSEGTL